MQEEFKENRGEKTSKTKAKSARSQRKSNKVMPYVLLGFAVAIGTFLRLWQLNALGYNSDEAVYAGQGAALVEDPTLSEFFPMFRAHPMLYQYMVSVVFLFGISDIAGRVLSAIVGVATIYVVYLIGAELYNRRTGAIAALFMAVMPYHIIVTRQVLLDGPMTFFATLSLYLLVRFGTTRRAVWLYATGAGMGLTFLAKETGIILMGSIYAFLALSSDIRIRIKDLIIAMGCMAWVMAAYPIAPRLAGHGSTSTTGHYIIWQLFRRPNHDWTFYPSTTPFAVGPLLLIVAIAGVWLLRRNNTWRETLLVWWILVPTVFFQLWPVKGFHYLLPGSAPLAVLAARALVYWKMPGLLRRGMYWMRPVAVTMVAFSLFIVSWGRVQTVHSATLLAGSGGAPGGREMGSWIQENTPEGSTFMTLGPSMANIIQFYGNRKAYGLSVSPNPLHRNPSYEPIVNPDFRLRNGDLQYIVWDSFSANRSTFFSQKLFTYIDRYHGRVVHTQTIPVQTPAGHSTEQPIIIVYEVRP